LRLAPAFTERRRVPPTFPIQGAVRGSTSVRQLLDDPRKLADVVQALQGGEDLAVVDLEVQVNEEVSLPCGLGEALRQLARQIAVLREVQEDVGIVGRGTHAQLGGELSSYVDANLDRDLETELLAARLSSLDR